MDLALKLVVKFLVKFLLQQLVHLLSVKVPLEQLILQLFFISPLLQ
jgi:hypothetical protein